MDGGRKMGGTLSGWECHLNGREMDRCMEGWYMKVEG